MGSLCIGLQTGVRRDANTTLGPDERDGTDGRGTAKMSGFDWEDMLALGQNVGPGAATGGASEHAPGAESTGTAGTAVPGQNTGATQVLPRPVTQASVDGADSAMAEDSAEAEETTGVRRDPVVRTRI